MLSDKQLDEFEQNGYLVVENLVCRDRVIDPLVAEYTDRLRVLCKRWVADKKLPVEASFGDMTCMIKACAEARVEYFQPLNIALPDDSVQAHTPFHAGPAVFNMITDPALLDAVQRLIGPEITSSPCQQIVIKAPQSLHQNTLNSLDATDTARTTGTAHTTHRPHTPDTQNVSEFEKSNTRTQAQKQAAAPASRFISDLVKHSGVGRASSNRLDSVDAWVAVTDVNRGNGCLHVIPGSHRLAAAHRVTQPFREDDADPVAVPVRTGGVVLIHADTQHRFSHNRSNTIAWKFRLRYHATGESTGHATQLPAHPPQYQHSSHSSFPSFVVRSESSPESVLTSAHTWRQLWEDARKRLSDEAALDNAHRWIRDGETTA